MENIFCQRAIRGRVQPFSEIRPRVCVLIYKFLHAALDSINMKGTAASWYLATYIFSTANLVLGMDAESANPATELSRSMKPLRLVGQQWNKFGQLQSAQCPLNIKCNKYGNCSVVIKTFIIQKLSNQWYMVVMVFDCAGFKMNEIKWLSPEQDFTTAIVLCTE